MYKRQLDLNEKKSFIRWTLGQGYTVFAVSWVNPDETLAPVSYTHLRAHETVLDLVCRLLLEKKNK